MTLSLSGQPERREKRTLTLRDVLGIDAPINLECRSPNWGNQKRFLVKCRIFLRYKFTCVYCGRSAPEVPLTIDHVIPKSKGGRGIQSNLVCACLACNRAKGDRLLKGMHYETQTQTV